MTSPDKPVRRRRARDETVAEILCSARAQLDHTPPAALSFRAIARELGLVSSAVYRYFPSRDALLTALLVSVYDELGAHVEAADAAITDRTRTAARLAACTHAVRGWAFAHPNDYALLYGSPVHGYAAPQDTIDPASRITSAFLRIVTDEHGTETGKPGAESGTASDLRAALEPVDIFVEQTTGTRLPDELMLRTLMAWTTVFGTVSFELWGHLQNGPVTPGYVDAVVDRLAEDLRLS
ncbi:TetR/AcrR family transcriptional regulator [Mumia sp. Pv 4-285]|uniref:TetR/AcrR family transcriptional regulator n=1 Tax=Mumia qirimensis TaxID=3234852 RepID=UPI00351D8AF5